jgi:hypothetical protein
MTCRRTSRIASGLKLGNFDESERKFFGPDDGLPRWRTFTTTDAALHFREEKNVPLDCMFCTLSHSPKTPN